MQNETTVFKTRRSCRNFDGRPVPEELLNTILEAGMYAPSGMNRQSAIILAVTNRELRDRLSRMNLDIVLGRQLQTTSGHSDPFSGAPVVLVVLARKDSATRVYDGSIVMENMLIAAHSLGLGSCWIHRAKEVFETEEGKALMKKWGIDEKYKGIGNCILGYSDKPVPEAKPRREGRVIYVNNK